MAGCARGGGEVSGGREGRRETGKEPAAAFPHSLTRGVGGPGARRRPEVESHEGKRRVAAAGENRRCFRHPPPPQAFCVVPPGGAPPALPALGLYHCGGRGGTTGCEGGELLEAEGSLLGVGLSLRELKSSGLSLNIVFSFPKCHVLSSHWAGKEGNTTATWR